MSSNLNSSAQVKFFARTSIAGGNDIIVTTDHDFVSIWMHGADGRPPEGLSFDRTMARTVAAWLIEAASRQPIETADKR